MILPGTGAVGVAGSTEGERRGRLRRRGSRRRPSLATVAVAGAVEEKRSRRLHSRRLPKPKAILPACCRLPSPPPRAAEGDPPWRRGGRRRRGSGSRSSAFRHRHRGDPPWPLFRTAARRQKVLDSRRGRDPSSSSAAAIFRVRDQLVRRRGQKALHSRRGANMSSSPAAAIFRTRDQLVHRRGQEALHSRRGANPSSSPAAAIFHAGISSSPSRTVAERCSECSTLLRAKRRARPCWRWGGVESAAMLLAESALRYLLGRNCCTGFLLSAVWSSAIQWPRCVALASWRGSQSSEQAKAPAAGRQKGAGGTIAKESKALGKAPAAETQLALLAT